MLKSREALDQGSAVQRLNQKMGRANTTMDGSPWLEIWDGMRSVG